MDNNTNYRFSLNKKIYIIFNSNGYVVEAKGFGMLMWSNTNPDKELVGKHVDEVSKMLEKNGAEANIYTNFEIGVHIPLLEIMLEEKNKQ